MSIYYSMHNNIPLIDSPSKHTTSPPLLPHCKESTIIM
jgi:hypothetical protein